VTTGTGSLAGSGGQYGVVAQAVRPRVSSDGTVDAASFTVTSTINAGNFKTTTGTTTISVPVMGLTKAVDSSDPRPGEEIKYTITYSNSGNGRSFQFTVTDSIPANRTYVAQSVRLNSIAKTDEPDGDEVIVSRGLITVWVGTVNPQASGSIEFRVRIN
jgi:uncharacterized repeat protein (TIGR01451 family)